MSAILEQPIDVGVFRTGPVVFESHKLTQPESQYSPKLLEPLPSMPWCTRGKRFAHISSTSLSSCTLIMMPACSGYNSSTTSVITRRTGLICSPSTSTTSRSCIFLAEPTQRTS